MLLALVVKNLPANAGDVSDSGSIPGLAGSSGEGKCNSLQYSCPENSMDRGAWWATVHGVAKSQTRLSDCTAQFMLCLSDVRLHLTILPEDPGIAPF